MGKTYKDAPYHVMLKRYGVESHDHTKGECDIDLPEECYVSYKKYHRHYYGNCKKWAEYVVSCYHNKKTTRVMEYNTVTKTPYYDDVHGYSEYSVVYYVVNNGDTVDIPHDNKCLMNKENAVEKFGDTALCSKSQIVEHDNSSGVHVFNISVRDESQACVCDNWSVGYKNCNREDIPADIFHEVHGRAFGSNRWKDWFDYDADPYDRREIRDEIVSWVKDYNSNGEIGDW